MVEVKVAGVRSWLTAAVVSWSVFGQVSISFDGSDADATSLNTGQQATFELEAAANAPLAVLASPDACFIPTQYGFLQAHPLAAQATIVFDGFNPAHYAFAWSVASGGGLFSTPVTPFVQGGGGPAAYSVQALSFDPTSPTSLRLSNHIRVTHVPPVPSITSLQPNVASPGDLITISGFGFVSDPGALTVTLGGAPCAVAAATSNTIWATVPYGANSGAVRVEHVGGASAADDQMHVWVAVIAGAPVGPQVPGYQPASTQSVTGALGQGGFATYQVALEPGRQLVAEVYPYNTLLGRIEYAPPTPGFAFIDPKIEVLLNPENPWPLFVEDDAGPANCPAVGPGSQNVFYVAEQSETVLVRVSFKHPTSAGSYLIVFGSAPSLGLPLTVQRIWPEIVNENELVVVQGTGFDPAAPSGNFVLLQDGAVPAITTTSSTMTFLAPPGYRSGPVGVATTAGTAAPIWERTDTFLAIRRGGLNIVLEGEVPTLAIPSTTYAQIGGVADIDDFNVELAAGQVLRVECFACDFGASSILNSTTFFSPIVDPEIRIIPPVATLPVYAWDMNAGPGLNAMLGGGSSTPAFTAPAAGTYRVRITGAFWLSWGDYYLILNPGP